MSKRIRLIDAVPDLKDFWDFELNTEGEPEDYSASESRRIYTFCPKCRKSLYRTSRNSWKRDANGVGHIICCKNCGKKTDTNLLVDLCPAIKDVWNYDKNENNPEYYTVSSGKYVYMNCPQCGKEVYRTISDSVKCDDGDYRVAVCRECASKQGIKTRRESENNIQKRIPDIDKYWNYEDNHYLPSELSIRSKEKISLHCPGCGKVLKRRAHNSFTNKNGTYEIIRCAKCANGEANTKRALELNGPIIDECPEIDEWWDYEKNTIKPSEITRGSHDEVWFKCPACKNEVHRDIHTFVSVHTDGRLLPVACSNCGYSSKGEPENNLEVECPDIVNWWNYEKNTPFVPSQFTRGSQFAAYLTCPECNMELYTGIHSLVELDDDGKLIVRHSGRCRKLKAQSSDNNLVKNYPEITNWWDYDKNYPDRPEDFTLYSPFRAYFKCPDCQCETHRRITDAFFIKDNGVPTIFDCPYCKGEKPIPGVNSLQAVYPEVASKCISVSDPDRIKSDSSSREEWLCPDCQGTYYDLVINQVNGNGCPYCNNRQVLTGFNDLETLESELSKEWSPNNDRTSNEVLRTARSLGLWICPTCNGEYSYPIADRNVGDDACPYCNNRRVLTGFNDLATKHADLMEEWCLLENIFIGIDPHEVLDNDGSQAWWQCKECTEKYLMPIKRRVIKKKRNHVPCPRCNGRRWKKVHFV